MAWWPRCRTGRRAWRTCIGGSRVRSSARSRGPGCWPICAGCWASWSARTVGRWPRPPARCPPTACSGCCAPRTGTPMRSATSCATTWLLGPGGVLIVDETGFIKKGSRSAGVARQYTGTTGKIDNCQIGVFLAYAAPSGRALIDRELYLPKAWIEDRERARAAGIGDEVDFATKPDLARTMLTRALQAGVPAGWLTADEVYGQDKRLRVWCEQHGLRYVLATRSNDTVATVDWRQRQVRALVAELPGSAWRRCSAGAGAHGPRLYDWARIELLAGFDPSWARWVLARRSIPKDSDEPAELAYYVCAGPAETTLEQLIVVAGGRWRIEECFAAAKNEAGLASYQVRDYTAWYRHITLAMLAHAYLSATRATAEQGAPRPQPSSSSR